MIEGKTESGFQYVIDDAALDDWELLEDLYKADAGDIEGALSAMKRLLGPEQRDALKEHLRDPKTGRVSLQSMLAAYREILTAGPHTKKS